MPLIDINILTLNEAPHQTNLGIRDDTSSRGVDLAGAVIAATYADGSTENLTWQALDPYTNGGANGTDITMFFGFSIHELTTTKLLTSLEIDLTPASSVFDMTTTMEDDHDGVNTPTSKNGFPFEFSTDDTEVDGSITATYSGIVNLVDRPADGDLYTMMLVDFSGLSTGGVLGAVTWNSDIDTMRNLGDLIPKPPSSASTTVTDVDDVYPWAFYVDVFDGNGVLASRAMTYDDGRKADTLYIDGVRATSIVTDEDDLFNWETIQRVYDPGNGRTGQTNTFDDGRVLVTDFDAGTRTQATMTDTDDVYGWARYVDVYAANGDRVSVSKTYDDGRQIDIAYVDGDRISTLTTDQDDAFDWTNIVRAYDANGDRSRQTTTFDDGRLLVIDFDAGTRAIAAMQDIDDVYDWDHYVDTYDAKGDRVSRIMTYDDAEQEIFLYQDGFSIA